MVNLKTKIDKHANDNEKRRRSIKEKEKAKLTQSKIIKEALANNILNPSRSKKVVFSDGDEYKEAQRKIGNEKTELFNDSGSEDEHFEIKEKAQFGSKKGFNLLNLQSTYGNDERFKIDERFLEDKEDELEAEQNDKGNSGETEAVGEKDKQLKILEGFLGQSVASVESEKKAKKRTYEMVRYDASNKEHEKYVIKPESETKSPTKKNKEEKKKKGTKQNDVEQPKPQVSKEKFYEVSKGIKNSFKEKKHFSLLQTYGMNETNEDEESEVEKEEEEGDGKKKNKRKEKKEEEVESAEECETAEVEYIKFNEKNQEKTETEKPTVAVVKGIWKESFFFIPDDPRLTEGIKFINKKGSEDASEAIENYDKTRKILREILRLHMKKQMHKKDPFRNKVGGRNKKQLANLKQKNSRNTFNKKKPYKLRKEEK